jgi:hypothetical protein
MVALGELSAQWSILIIVWRVRVMRAGLVSHAESPGSRLLGEFFRSIVGIAWTQISLTRGFKMSFECNGHRSGCGLDLVEVLPDSFGSFARHHGGQGFGGGLLHVAQAAEVSEQALAGLGAYAGNSQ